MTADRAALVIFARAPVPGQAKTRLIPVLGPEGAAELYRCFLRDTLANAAVMDASVLVAAAEEGHVAEVSRLAAEACPAAEVIVQEGRDLGERMLNAFRHTLRSGYRRTVIVGSDVPSLPWERVSEALRLAGERDLTLGPSLDGGYYLIGMHAAIPRLFDGMAWGKRTVLVDTLRHAQDLQLTVSLLEPWYDVDTPRDLETLRSHLTALALAGHELPCPRTWEYMRARDGE